MKTGEEETENQMEMNLFVDQVDCTLLSVFTSLLQILKTVMRESGDRKIVFSSFSPDICTM